MKFALRAIVFLMVLSSLATQAHAQEAVFSKDAIIVEDTGSTNFSGYRIVIDSSGVVNVMPHGRVSINVIYPKGQYKVPMQTVKELMNDLDAVIPLSSLKSAVCARSASFGTSTFVTYKGQISPDIKCLASHKKFVDDIYTILGLIHKMQV